MTTKLNDNKLEQKSRIIITLNPLMKALFAKDDTLRYIVDCYLRDSGLPRLKDVVIPKEDYRLKLANDLYKEMTNNPSANYFIRELAVIYSQGFSYVSCTNNQSVYDFVFSKDISSPDDQSISPEETH